MREDRHTTDLAGAAAWQRHHAPGTERDVEYNDLPIPPHVGWHAPGTCWACDATRVVRAL